MCKIFYIVSILVKKFFVISNIIVEFFFREHYCIELFNIISEKLKTFLWWGRCDRILWYGKGVEQLYYIRSESKFSDHRPVSALFSTHIEIKSSSKELVEMHNIPPTILQSNHVSAVYNRTFLNFFEISILR